MTSNYADICYSNAHAWICVIVLGHQTQSLNECSPQMRTVYDTLIFMNAFPLSMPSRKRKHGYEDDDHVVKRQMVTEEVSLVGSSDVL